VSSPSLVAPRLILRLLRQSRQERIAIIIRSQIPTPTAIPMMFCCAIAGRGKGEGPDDIEVPLSPSAVPADIPLGTLDGLSTEVTVVVYVGATSTDDAACGVVSIAGKVVDADSEDPIDKAV
jgi:hypothetical protein